MHPVRRQISPHAARLRREKTDAEQRFWLEVRDRRLGGLKFRQQASIYPFVADFLCIEAMLIVEIDGSQHNEKVDRARTSELERRGYRVIRFWNNEVLTNIGGVLEVTRAAAHAEIAARQK